jgi:hypothetical protein
MKQKKGKLFFISFLLLNITTQVFASGAKLPVIATVDVPAVALEVPGGPYIDQIKIIAGNSACANTIWAGRGRAPAGYIKGVSLSYARSLCRLKNNSSLSLLMSNASSGNAAKDVMAYYQSIFKILSISINTTGEETLRALYTLGMGLGMRESSGAYCEGWDKSAGANRLSSAAEAGAFQTSYDSMAASPELSKLYNEYRSKRGQCFQDIFKQGVSCGALNLLGSGAGAEYQAFNIACPAFATEYAMTILRIQRSHYGPINRKEAQVIPACNQLLKSVEDLINNDPYACQDIL